MIDETMKVRPTKDFSTVTSDEEIARHSTLSHMTKPQALDAVACELMEFQIYCKRNNLKFLQYLLEMTILEARQLSEAAKIKNPKA